MALTGTSANVTRTAFGLKNRRSTDVLGPGAGETCPVTVMLTLPVYEFESVMIYSV